MGRSEIMLKILVGGFLGAELVGGSTLLALSVFAGFEAIQSPAFSATWLIAFAILGSWVAVRYLPRFSRDRGRIANFLIDPKHLGGSIGFQDSLNWHESDSFGHRTWTTARYGHQTNH